MYCVTKGMINNQLPSGKCRECIKIMHVYIYTISGTDTDLGTMHWAPVDELKTEDGLPDSHRTV